MSIDAGDALVRALHDHNPWWEHGTEAFSLPARQKSDFYHLARPDESDSQFEDQPLLGLVGRRGVGKTRSSISSFTIASRPVMIQNDSSISPSTPIRSTNSTPIGRTATACSSVLREQDSRSHRGRPPTLHPD